MTLEKKKEVVATITAMLQELVREDMPADEAGERCTTEMLTIREASEQVKGLSEHTVRQLVHQGRVPSIRTGEGRNGKILVPKAALIKYLCGDASDI